jgi:hypothetical protein
MHFTHVNSLGILGHELLQEFQGIRLVTKFIFCRFSRTVSILRYACAYSVVYELRLESISLVRILSRLAGLDNDPIFLASNVKMVVLGTQLIPQR